MNSARSAYTCFLFHKSFFLSYNGKGGASVGVAKAASVEEEEEEEQTFKCKMPNKVSQ